MTDVEYAPNDDYTLKQPTPEPGPEDECGVRVVEGEPRTHRLAADGPARADGGYSWADRPW